MPVQVELNEQEAALLIQAISAVRLAADEFTGEEQLLLKQVAERLAGQQVEGDEQNGVEASD